MNCLMAAWNAHEPELKGWLIQQAHSPEQAEDWLQELFLKALRHKERFCTLDDARSWLFRLARNMIADTHRKHLPILLDDVRPDYSETEPGPEDSQDMSTLLELHTCMLRVLSELPPDERDILEHCDIERMKQQDFAAQHQLSLPAVKSRLQRARRHLRANMVDACQIRFKDNRVCCFTPRT